MARGGGGLDPVQAEMVEPPVNADTLSSMKVRRDLRPGPGARGRGAGGAGGRQGDGPLGRGR